MGFLRIFNYRSTCLLQTACRYMYCENVMWSWP